MINKLFFDIIGIYRVVGVGLLLKWLFFLVIKFPEIIKVKNLEPADKCMGNDFIKVTREGKSAYLSGHQVFSGIREIWVRDCYLSKFLDFTNDKLVVDLGANIGIFTQLALSQNSKLKTISVEPNYKLLRNLKSSVERNKWSERSFTLEAFIGSSTNVQLSAMKTDAYKNAIFMSDLEFIDKFSIKEIDFLKIDIEGSEFSFIDKESNLLKICKKLAIEIHENGGKIDCFISYLEKNNFNILSSEWARGGCVLLASKN